MPVDEVSGPAIRQSLDSIQQPIGLVTSRWGAVLAKMGYPKPFPRNYVQIDNEHPPSFLANAGYDENVHCAVFKAPNHHRTQLTTEIPPRGCDRRDSNGEHLHMTSAELDAENSLVNPHLIIPDKTQFIQCALRFTAALPPHSFDILRVPVYTC